MQGGVDIIQSEQRLSRLSGFLQQDPDNLHLLRELIDLCLDLGRKEEAKQHLQHARTLAPDDLLLMQREGILLLSEENWLGAAAVFEHLLATQPDPVIAGNLAYACFFLQQYTRVKEVLQALQAQGLLNAELALLLLRALHHLGEMEEAMQLRAQYEATLADNKEFQAMSALLYLDHGDLEQARQASNTALNADHPHLEALVAGGTVALGLGEPELARARFEQVLARKPGEGRSLAGMGMLAMMEKDYTKAASELEKAVAAIPAHIGTRHVLGWCKILAGDLNAAQVIFQAALELDRNFGESHGALAVLDALRGDRAAAESKIRRALGLDPAGMSGRFAKMLLEHGNNPAKMEEQVFAVLSKQAAPFGGSVADMINKMKPH